MMGQLPAADRTPQKRPKQPSVATATFEAAAVTLMAPATAPQPAAGHTSIDAATRAHGTTRVFQLNGLIPDTYRYQKAPHLQRQRSVGRKLKGVMQLEAEYDQKWAGKLDSAPVRRRMKLGSQTAPATMMGADRTPKKLPKQPATATATSEAAAVMLAMAPATATAPQPAAGHMPKKRPLDGGSDTSAGGKPTGTGGKHRGAARRLSPSFEPAAVPVGWDRDLVADYQHQQPVPRRRSPGNRRQQPAGVATASIATRTHAPSDGTACLDHCVVHFHGYRRGEEPLKRLLRLLQKGNATRLDTLDERVSHVIAAPGSGSAPVPSGCNAHVVRPSWLVQSIEGGRAADVALHQHRQQATK